MTMTAPDDVDDAAVTTPGRRLAELDVLRGFALIGILPVNIVQQLVREHGTGEATLPLPVSLIFVERFLAIFGVLFGIGAGLFLQRARARTERPRLVLARRLAVLLAVGAAHFAINPGDVLVVYAVSGLLVLLPLSLLPARGALAVALVLLLVGPQIQTSIGVVPGLLALGYALAALRLPAALSTHPRRIAAALAVTGTLAVTWAALVLVGLRPGPVNLLGGGLGGTQDLLGPLSALVTGLAYCGVLLLALRTRLGPALDAVLAPMGRTALTNYLAATVLFLSVGPSVGVDSLDDGAAIAGLTVGILATQAVVSRLWLRSFRYGPAEWVWRCLTWGRRAPLSILRAERVLDAPSSPRPQLGGGSGR